jgi:hypothetical protein
MGEATVTGLAAGLLAVGRLRVPDACRRCKVLVVEHGSRRELGLVDVATTTSSGVGARAVCDPSSVNELFVAFAEPNAVGLSSIAGLTRPIGRDEPVGLRLTLRPDADHRVLAPIAPGLLRDVGVDAVEVIEPGQRWRIRGHQGVLAIDGEREVEFRGEAPYVTLSLAGPWSLDVARAMTLAASRGLLIHGTWPAGRSRSARGSMGSGVMTHPTPMPAPSAPAGAVSSVDPTRDAQ